MTEVEADPAVVPETTSISKTVMVFEDNVARLRAVIEKINKQARKVGVPEVTLTMTGKEDFRRVIRAPGDRGAEYRRVEIIVAGQMPKLAGWTMLGKIEWEDGVALLLTVPGMSIPESHRGLGQACQHCKTDRVRSMVLILRHEDGTVKQVGRTCLRDFLGAPGLDPERALSIAGTIAELLDGVVDEEEYGGAVERTKLYVNPSDVVEVTLSVLTDREWVPRSASEFKRATADLVAEVLLPSDSDSKEVRDYREAVLGRIDERMRAERDKAMAWAATHEGDSNEYLYNLAALSQQPMVSAKRIGLLASLYPAYRKDIGRQLEHARKAKSEWIGTPGEREVFTLTPTDERVYDNSYGTSHRIEFEDAAGNVVIWWSSRSTRSLSIEMGKPVAMKVTVKKHEEFRGVKTTVITRGVVAARVQ